MKNIKKIIPILIIFLTIGFAAVNYTLSLDGDTNLTGDLEDFKVYFSRVLINGVEDNSIVSSATELNFSNKLTNIGQEYIIDYDITNGSKYFDASISMTCTQGTEYLSITNTFDTSNLTSLETRSGKLVLKRLKSLASNESQFTKITCNINAQPIERETLGEGTITNPANPFYIGREVFIGTEGFNIISEQEDTITMLAKNNIRNSAPYKQTEEQQWTAFSNNKGWEYSPGPQEIDIQKYDGYTKKILNDYTTYIKNGYNIEVNINLISLNELSQLGCKTPSDYGYNNGGTGWHCNNSPYKEWLITNQLWWTRSTTSDIADSIWIVGKTGNGYLVNDREYTYGVRPTITISKKTAQLLLKTYKIGEEISIGDEKFNVIRDDITTVTLFAKYNLDSNYKQTETQIWNQFSKTSGWEEDQTLKDIDIFTWSTEPKAYVSEYVNYLKTITNNTKITGNLITLQELESLGCVIPPGYMWVEETSKRTCKNSSNASWIINDQNWWTRSITPGSNVIWLYYSGNIDGNYSDGYAGIRPVITISKEALEQIK